MSQCSIGHYFKHLIRRPSMVALFVFVYYGWSRLYIIWKYGDRAFGYDVGIYRRYIISYFDRLGDATIHPFAFSHLSSALSILGSNVDAIMYGWYFVISMCICLLLYFLMNKWFGKTSAILSILLFATSMVQFEFYQWYYYRNLLAVFLFFLLLYFFEYRSYLIIFPMVIIGSIHPPSFIPIFFSLVIYVLVRRSDRRYLIISLFLSLFSIAVLNWKELLSYFDFFTLASGTVPVLQNNLSSGFKEFTGQFIDFNYFWKASFLYIPFAMIGAVYTWRRSLVVFLIGITCGVLIIIGFVLYRRYFVILDIALIIFSAGWVGEIIGKKIEGIAWKIALFFCVCFFTGRSIYQIINFQPLLTSEEFASIQEMEKIPAKNMVMSLSSYYAPWLLGYSGHDVIAPGMFELNKWTKDEWMLFWEVDQPAVRKSLFSKYGSGDIYIFMGIRDRWVMELFTADSNFFSVNQYIWRYHI